jgi:hypothetical protein
MPGRRSANYCRRDLRQRDGCSRRVIMQRLLCCRAFCVTAPCTRRRSRLDVGFADRRPADYVTGGREKPLRMPCNSARGQDGEGCGPQARFWAAALSAIGLNDRIGRRRFDHNHSLHRVFTLGSTWHGLTVCLECGLARELRHASYRTFQYSPCGAQTMSGLGHLVFRPKQKIHPVVMAGLVPAIHEAARFSPFPWIPSTRWGMTVKGEPESSE